MRDSSSENAFPMFTSEGEPIHASAAGLTKLEYFTGLALQARAKDISFYIGKKETQDSLENAAEECVQIAKAIIKALDEA